MRHTCTSSWLHIRGWAGLCTAVAAFSSCSSAARPYATFVCTGSCKQNINPDLRLTPCPGLFPLYYRMLQADFATTAIEFLHRVGRTARAGKAGKVTSLYGKADAVLAEALRQYVQEGKSIEECFSRNRSFSRKVKRYGKFVPRGQEGEQRT